MLGVLKLQALMHHDGRARRPVASPDRLLAWAPAPRATRYRVLIVEGERVVLDTVTTDPHLRVDFPDGAYRWWVWPILPGGSQAPAVVQATLAFPP
jgi:hypothetical protein